MVNVDKTSSIRYNKSTITMLVDATYTITELSHTEPTGRVIAIIDVLRASSTITQALANGCRAIIPVRTVEEALETAANLSQSERCLGGERRGLPIAGFDLGNSPAEYSRERVQGKTIVFTTTNGTMAINAASGAAATLIGCFLNLRRLVSHLSAAGANVILAAAGRHDLPVLDDIVCAGLIAKELQREVGDRLQLTRRAAMAVEFYDAYGGRILDALRDSASGRNLLEIGLGDDLQYCARVGVLDVLPVYRGGILTCDP